MTEHMTPEEFRVYGHQLIDWLAEYRERIEDLPILASVEPGDISSMLPERAPEQAEPFEALIGDLDRVVVPGVTHWQSPNWFAYFPANTSPPSVLAELVSAGLGLQGMLWSTSPVMTELESRVLDWLVELMGLPSSWKSTGTGGGVIQMSASDATHTAIVVARHRRMTEGHAEDMVVYASSEAHSSIEKGCTVAGVGHCRKVAVDARFAMDADALREMVEADQEAGLIPIAVVSAIGTTATTAVDPLVAISDVASEHGMWHHVDAAYAGTAMLCGEFRVHQPDLDRVDSYTFNPHKWMMVNFDCNVLWVADRRPLIETLSVLPPYLRNAATEAGAVIDYRDWHVPLGRRFRALKLWWVIRSYGAEGLRSLVRTHVGLADDLAERIEGDARFALFAPHPFGLVCFTLVDGNDATRRLASALNATGRVAITASEIDGTAFIRVVIGQTFTEQRHVDALWAMIDELADSRLS
ncbi:MAG TPA: aminotransferase class I/II-fold pyridoxal phosphate-dependent enzyme [Acidimicrobiia bacterium]|nr:aminotransferase class I/II-fold pyridoxal phosphate-dependent enzyme [Acidimicrobiia bacterium]